MGKLQQPNPDKTTYDLQEQRCVSSCQVRRNQDQLAEGKGNTEWVVEDSYKYQLLQHT
jgi:hypothetical protein